MKKIILLFLLITAFLQAEPEAVYLTWQNDPQTTMVIHWITSDKDHRETLNIREAGQEEWLELEGASFPMPKRGPYLIHTVEAIDLKPNTAYQFKVDSEIFSFKTAPKTLPIRFIDGGDVYHDSIALLDQMNRAAAQHSPHFAIIGGDIAYSDKHSGKEYTPWMEWLKSYQKTMVTPEGHLIPMIPVIGNHDCDKISGLLTTRDAPMFYHIFSLHDDDGYRVIDFGNFLSIFILDSNHTHPIEGKQTEWLKKELSLRAHVPYKFASYHVPAYPSKRNFNGKNHVLVRKNFVPLFEEYGLIAAFEHHDHLYKRTFPLKNNEIRKDGVIYLGDGCWGAAKPRKSSGAWYLAQTVSSTHVIVTEVKDNEVIFEAINPENQIIDRYVLEK